MNASSLTLRIWNTGLSQWWPVALGLAVLFIPTYVRLNGGAWNEEAHAHGPFVLMVVVWLVARIWPKAARMPAQGLSVLGSALLLLGLLVYVVGRSQDLIILEVGAEIPILAGVVLALMGWPALRAFWFPLLFLVFFIPLPGFIIDAVTAPLKLEVSAAVDSTLYFVGYPISRTGVVLQIGSYQLLVADACSGLNSIYSLSSMGILYLYLMQHKNRLRNILLLASILPMAFAANVLRVIILVLVTYYFGDEAGQGFVHDFAGIALFVFGLLMLFVLDKLLGVFMTDGKAGAHA